MEHNYSVQNEEKTKDGADISQTDPPITSHLYTWGYDQEEAEPPMPPPLTQERQEANINSWLPLSIVTAILCCVPIGVLAIINSVRAREQSAAGNHDNAQKLARKALHLNIAGIVTGTILLIIVIMLIII